MTELEQSLLKLVSEQSKANEVLERKLTGLTGQVETLQRQLAILPTLNARLDELERFLSEQNRRIEELSRLLSRYAPMLNG